MSVLRLQLARSTRRNSRGRVRRRVDRRSRIGAAARLGTQSLQHLLRRRHAESALRRRTRPAADGDPHALAALARGGDHARSQPGHRRGHQVRRLSRRRRQSPLARHPELQPGALEGARPHPRRRRSAPRDRDRRRALRQLQPRPDVWPARADIGRGVARRRHGARLLANAPLVLPADARTEHRVRRASARTARIGRLRRHAGGD